MKLYPNQVELVEKMRYREENQTISLYGDVSIQTNVSIISDLPGRGRKVSICNLIMNDRDLSDGEYVNCMEVRGEGAQIITYKQESRIPVRATFIITRDVGGWEKVMKRGVNVYTVRKKSETVLEPSEYDVVICASDMYNDMMRGTQKYKWKRCIYDNPMLAYIPKMRTIVSSFYWMMTPDSDGLISPSRKNPEHFLSKLFCDLSPVRDRHIVEALLVKSTVGWKTIDSLTHISYDINEEHVFVQSMMASKQIVPLITILGGYVIDNIPAYMKTKHLSEEYKIKSKLRVYKDNDVKLEKWTIKQRQLTNKIHTKADEITCSLKGDDCSICFERFEYPTVAGCCHKIFCGECLLKCLFVDKSCPLCREPIQIRDIRCIVGNRKETLRHIEETYPSRMSHIKKIASPTAVIYSKDCLHMELTRNHIEYIKCDDIYYIGKSVMDKSEYTDLILYNIVTKQEKLQIIGSFNCVERTVELRIHEFNI
jgi:hypothetical protein